MSNELNAECMTMRVMIQSKRFRMKDLILGQDPHRIGMAAEF